MAELQDLYAALHEAFHAVQRRLEAHAAPIARRYTDHRANRLDQPAADT